jgi:predicted AlkP superfamily phosphohydrolase/phosphomutase/Flp pilus assembly protein TadD
LVLALALALGACDRTPSGRVLVLALDGVDPEIVDLLMAEGKLPSFAKLRQHGAYAPLLSEEPLLSPVVWTTIATGKTPDQHGIGHFMARQEGTGEEIPATSRMRRVRALWNVLSDAGRSVAVVGWWATWPAETVKGWMVSDHLAYHFLFGQGLTGDARGEGKTYPPELLAELEPLVVRPQQLTRDDLAPFVRVSAADLARPFDLQDDLSGFRWALAAAETHRRVGLHLWRTRRPDNLLVYIEATDSTAHLFGHLFRAGPLAGELAEQQRRYGGAVEAMYLYADRLVGELLAVIDDETTLVVLSDHGFELGELPEDPSKLRDMRRVSERYHRQRGILYLYGRGVRANRRLADPTIRDVAPTLLALNGLPAADDMPGRVLSEGLDIEVRARVASYELAGGGAKLAQDGKAPAPDRAVDREKVARLRSLGYLGGEASPHGDRNLAAVLFEQGKLEEAAAAYRDLVERNPEDSALRASLAGALGALGRYDEALAQIEEALRLEPLNIEAYHNRAVIHERRGEPAAAIADYRTALRYRSDYEPARSALRRLGAAPTAGEVAHTPEQARALELAERASDAARRGDYPQALADLAQAERLAPRLALVHQYRANVAYLMGDQRAARVALEKALEIEPDNLLYRQNLERLRGEG